VDKQGIIAGKVPQAGTTQDKRVDLIAQTMKIDGDKSLV
jgi:hypothetical protein